MYCEKCDKAFSNDVNFCDICGERLIEKKLDDNKITKRKNKNKKKTRLIITLIIVGIFLLVSSTVFFGVSLFKMIDKMGKIEYIELGNDKIPTMYMSNKDIQIDYYDKETNLDGIEVEIEYYDNLYQYDMIDTYIEILEEVGFTCVDVDENDWYLVKESIDQGNVILVNIYENYDYDNELYFTIIYEKEQADISKYIEEVTYKRVGEEKYGFIDVDSTWSPYVETRDMIQYGGKTGGLILYYIENPNFNAREYMSEIYNSVNRDGGNNLEITEVTIDGYNAYQLSGYYAYEDIYFAIWCFLDNDNIIHYIEIDSLKYESDVFSKIESYSVLK